MTTPRTLLRATMALRGSSWNLGRPELEAQGGPEVREELDLRAGAAV